MGFLRTGKLTLISYFNAILIVFYQYFAILSTIYKKIINNNNKQYKPKFWTEGSKVFVNESLSSYYRAIFSVDKIFVS